MAARRRRRRSRTSWVDNRSSLKIPKVKPAWRRWARSPKTKVKERWLRRIDEYTDRVCAILTKIGGRAAKRALRIRACTSAHLAGRKLLVEHGAGITAYDYAGSIRCSDFFCACCAADVRGRRARAAIALLASSPKRPNHKTAMLLFTVQHSKSDDPKKIAAILERAFRSLTDPDGDVVGRIDFRGAHRMLHLSWPDGPRNVRVANRGPNGWHPHIHALVRRGSRPDMKFLGRRWREEVKKVGGQGGRVGCMRKTGRIRRRCHYLNKSQAKFVARLHTDDLEIAVRFFLGPSGRNRRLSETVGCLRTPSR